MYQPNIFSQNGTESNMTGSFGAPPVSFSLSQYTSAIGNAIRADMNLKNAWVRAELSDVRVAGGHCYMELIEKNDQGQTVAKLRATIWASQLSYIRNKFYNATGRDIASGLKILVRGSATHHTLYGLSFTIQDIDPNFTLGDMERIRREILERLHREGVLGQNRQLTMPMAPQRIAIISADGAAGYGDFVNQLLSNTEHFRFSPCLFPAVMQGDRVSASVRDALDRIEISKEDWDCVAIVRGGGATTDLNGFDDYDLAHRVATFPLPVVVGIGHERDRTVLDEIAHTRLKTPTAVASFFVDTLRNAYMRVTGLIDMVTRYSSDRLVGEQRRLDNLEATIPVITRSLLEAAKAHLEKEITRIPVLVASRIQTAYSQLDTAARVLGVLSNRQFSLASNRLDEYKSRIRIAADTVMKRSAADLMRINGMVDVLSPANTLRRGYSITRINGKAVTDAQSLKPGDIIATELKDGTVDSVVK